MTTGANAGLIKTYDAGAAIVKYRIVKFDSSDGTVIQGAAATDLLIGVANILGAAAAGDAVDVVKSGIAKVEFGGTVARGAAVTSDANGKAVAAAPASGVNNNIIGYAENSHVDGDIGSIFIAPSIMQGA